MKPWFNTTLILALTVIWIIIGWQLHKRLSHVEMIQSIKQVSESQLILQHDAWHQQMKKEDLVHSIDETK